MEQELNTLLEERDRLIEKRMLVNEDSDDWKNLTSSIHQFNDDIARIYELIYKAEESDIQLGIERDKAEIDRDKAIEEANQHIIENEAEQKRQHIQFTCGVIVPLIGLGVTTVVGAWEYLKLLHFSETGSVTEKDAWKFINIIKSKVL